MAVISIVASPGELAEGGGAARLWIETAAAPGVPAPDIAVQLSASSGEIDRAEVVTDRTGHAIANWRGTSTTVFTAIAGAVRGSARLVVATPTPLPPPSQPRPPAPTPAPLPPVLPPAPAPAELQVTLGASASDVAVGVPATFTATVSNLNGRTVAAYQWDFDGDGTPDATTTASTRTFAYTKHGVVIARVTVLTVDGREASATLRVVVTN